MGQAHLVVVTGMSGSGRTTAIRALEDVGFFCIDNLPIVLLDKFLVLAERHEEIRRVAVGVDVRERSFLGLMSQALQEARALGHRVNVVFLDASDDVLIRRYSETRRRHPLAAEAGSLADAIRLERKLLEDVRAEADWVVDTSDLNVHALKNLIQQAYGPQSERRMSVAVVSFGYRHGMPREADYVFDCRFLPNPYFQDNLRSKSGLDEDVKGYIIGHADWGEFFSRLAQFIEFTIPRHEKEGKPIITLAFGCTGGRHRSVVVAEEVARWLKDKGFSVRVSHRDVEERQ